MAGDPGATTAALAGALGHARRLAVAGEDEAAKRAYVALLQRDPTHPAALVELGVLAEASGHRAAARTAFLQAVRCHPRHAIARVALANLLFEAGDLVGARRQYEAALANDPRCPGAHQGMARIMTEAGEAAAAGLHWRAGFAGRAVVTRRYRGAGRGVPLLLLVSARGGNIPVRHWIDDRVFAITALYAEFHDPARPLPPHALIVNAIGDADLCQAALARAGEVAARARVPVVNPPARVRTTGRAEAARRLARIAGVTAPWIRPLRRATAPAAADDLAFPLLLRAPGFHTGRHFVLVPDRAAWAGAIAGLPGEDLLAIQYLDARGADGLARKYRVMFIDGLAYPVHLAISAEWKVHYFSAAMAANPGHRAEERRFLEDMPGVLGARAMAALAAIAAALGLDYAGVDFALAADGSVLLFEANAAMVLNPPDPDPMWDYRRPGIARALGAARRMLLQRSTGAAVGVA